MEKNAEFHHLDKPDLFYNYKDVRNISLVLWEFPFFFPLKLTGAGTGTHWDSIWPDHLKLHI